MANPPKFLNPQTVAIRVPVAIVDEVREYARSMDRSRWVEECVFTLGPLYKHRENVQKKWRLTK